MVSPGMKWLSWLPCDPISLLAQACLWGLLCNEVVDAVHWAWSEALGMPSRHPLGWSHQE